MAIHTQMSPVAALERRDSLPAAASDFMAGLGGGAASRRIKSSLLVVRMGPLLSFEPHTDICQPDEDFSLLCSKKIPQEM